MHGMTDDPLRIAGRELTSRLVLGSGGFANHELLFFFFV